jgi:hypothetical protein
MFGPFWWSSFTLSVCLSNSDKRLKDLNNGQLYVAAAGCLKANL